MTTRRTLAEITADEIDHILTLAGVDFTTLWSWKPPTTLKHLGTCQQQARACGEPSTAVELWKPFLDDKGKPKPSLHGSYAAYFLPRVIGGAQDAVVVLRHGEQTFLPSGKDPVRVTGASVLMIGPGYVLDNGVLCCGASDALIQYMQTQGLITAAHALYAYRYSVNALEQVVYDQTCLLYDADAVPLDCRETSLATGHQLVDRLNDWATEPPAHQPRFEIGAPVRIAVGVTRALIGDGLVGEHTPSLDGAPAEVIGAYPHYAQQQVRYKVAITLPADETAATVAPTETETDAGAGEATSVVQRLTVFLPTFCLVAAEPVATTETEL